MITTIHSRRGFYGRIKVPQKIREGEEVTVQLETNRPARVLLVSVALGGDSYVLLPNKFMPKPVISPGASFSFPTQEIREKGFKLIGKLPADVTSTSETLVLIAVEDEKVYEAIVGDEFQSQPYTVLPGEEFSKRVQTQINAMPLGKYARAVQSYEITK